MSHRPYRWVYAVRRDCNSKAPTCAKVCADSKLRAQDSQTASYTTWKCIGSMHVYYNRPTTGDGINPKLGLKQYYFNLLTMNVVETVDQTIVTVYQYKVTGHRKLKLKFAQQKYRCIHQFDIMPLYQ